MSQKYVTMGWDFRPTIRIEGGYTLPRDAENIINKQYYPTGVVGEWPICPETGERLPIFEERKKSLVQTLIKLL